MCGIFRERHLSVKLFDAILMVPSGVRHYAAWKMSKNFELRENAEFESFADFEAALTNYCEQHNVLYVISNCRTVENANKRIAEKSIPYPSHFKYSSVEYTCKHYGRPKPTSKGIRPNQRSFKMNCKSIIKASVNRKKSKLVVFQFDEEHVGHPVSRDIFLNYPEVRRLDDTRTDTDKPPLDLRAQAWRVRDYLSALSGKSLCVEDIHNARQAARGLDSEEAQLLQALEDILQDDLGETIVQVITSADNMAQIIYWQTGDMKQTVQDFPEVLLLDLTYKTNNRQMLLLSVMAVNGSGVGQVVAQGLVANESEETVRTFLKIYRENNHGSDSTQVFIIDKDFNICSLLRELWPDAVVMFCLFHALQTLKRKVQSLDLKLEEKKNLNYILVQMANSASEEDYNKLLGNMEKSAPHDFLEYFHKDWHSCQEMWVNHHRKKHYHLGKRTIKRLENFHQKIKANLQPSMTVGECISELLNMQKGEAVEMSRQEVVEQSTVRYCHGDDSKFSTLAQDVATPYAAGIMLKEMGLAEVLKYERHPEAEDSHEIVTQGNHEHKYEVHDQEGVACQHDVFVAQGLPCRRLFATDMEKNLFKNKSGVANRWLKARQQKRAAFQRTCMSKRVLRKVSGKKNMTSREKFTEMNRVLLDIAKISAQVGHTEFCARFEVITGLLNAWKDGKQVLLTVVDSTSGVDGTNEGLETIGAENAVNASSTPMWTPLTAQESPIHESHTQNSFTLLNTQGTQMHNKYPVCKNTRNSSAVQDPAGTNWDSSADIEDPVGTNQNSFTDVEDSVGTKRDSSADTADPRANTWDSLDRQKTEFDETSNIVATSSKNSPQEVRTSSFKLLLKCSRKGRRKMNQGNQTKLVPGNSPGKRKRLQETLQELKRRESGQTTIEGRHIKLEDTDSDLHYAQQTVSGPI